MDSKGPLTNDTRRVYVGCGVISKRPCRRLYSSLAREVSVVIEGVDWRMVSALRRPWNVLSLSKFDLEVLTLTNGRECCLLAPLAETPRRRMPLLH
jgi:hypothetical protein